MTTAWDSPAQAMTADDDLDISGAVVHLFSNDVAPLLGNTRNVYDESEFPGYAPITVSSMLDGALRIDTEISAEWIVARDMAQPERVVGFFVTLADKVVYAEQLPASYLGVAGDKLTVGFPIVNQ